MALSMSGNIYSWGRNDFGQLGLGHTDSMETHFKTHIINRHIVRCVMKLTQTSLLKMVQVLTFLVTVLPGSLCLQDRIGLKVMHSVEVLAIIETCQGHVEKGKENQTGLEHLHYDSPSQLTNCRALPSPLASFSLGLIFISCKVMSWMQ